jgi:hypothetical protein
VSRLHAYAQILANKHDFMQYFDFVQPVGEQLKQATFFGNGIKIPKET